MLQVTVYEKPACVGCRFTKRKLDEFDINYNTVDLSEDPEAHRRVAGLGYLSAPVVEVDLGFGATWTWSGYSPSQIEILDHAFGCDSPTCDRCPDLFAT